MQASIPVYFSGYVDLSCYMSCPLSLHPWHAHLLSHRSKVKISRNWWSVSSTDGHVLCPYILEAEVPSYDCCCLVNGTNKSRVRRILVSELWCLIYFCNVNMIDPHFPFPIHSDFLSHFCLSCASSFLKGLGKVCCLDSSTANCTRFVHVVARGISSNNSMSGNT